MHFCNSNTLITFKKWRYSAVFYTPLHFFYFDCILLYNFATILPIKKSFRTLGRTFLYSGKLSNVSFRYISSASRTKPDISLSSLMAAFNFSALYSRSVM